MAGEKFSTKDTIRCWSIYFFCQYSKLIDLLELERTNVSFFRSSVDCRKQRWLNIERYSQIPKTIGHKACHVSIGLELLMETLEVIN